MEAVEEEGRNRKPMAKLLSLVVAPLLRRRTSFPPPSPSPSPPRFLQRLPLLLVLPLR
uniref:Uncharacterized protein n=1 Tax=Aegilops tauschii TaxID=37682 RepID=N1R0S3_AEGTA